MIVKVVIDSPLPQLDRLFEYAVPESLVNQVRFGIRIRVSIGASKKLYDAFVVGVAELPEYQGNLAQIESVVSNQVVLTKEILELSVQLASRQGVPLSDILKSAIPSRTVSVEKEFVGQETQETGKTKNAPTRKALLVSAVRDESDHKIPHWCSVLARIAKEKSAQGSVAICIPTDNQLSQFKQELEALEIEFVDFSSAQTASKRYLAFLTALHRPNTIVIGNRAVLFAPSTDLDSLIIWEESDFSHVDQSSPYLQSRDIALVRQSQIDCSLIFASIGISTEIERLIQIGYLELEIEGVQRPKIAYETDQNKAETLVAKSLKTGLVEGPVLVQVGALGHSVALYCKNCNSKVQCTTCAGPLWLDSSAKPVCRWCASLNYAARCPSCGERELKQGRAGATRSVAEFGKAFPGIPVMESTSENRILEIKQRPCIVISTPGCEPLVDGGYRCIIFQDAKNQLNWDSLRSVEDAVYSWNRAIVHLAKEGLAVLPHVGGKLAEQYALWKQREIAAEQLQERLELNLPPVIRLGSISGDKETATTVAQVASNSGAEVLGPITLEDGTARFVFKYAYRDGTSIAKEIKAASLKAGASKPNGASRSIRNVRVKMDDRQVI